MKGFKTVAFGIAVAVLPAALDFLGGIDPVAVFGVSPAAGAALGTGVMLLRAFTTSPIFKRG